MGSTYTHFAAATAAVADQFITVTDMKRGTYGAVANGGLMPSAGARHVTITLTRVDAVDSPLGTVTIVGTDLRGDVITEVMTPLDNTVATSVAWFKTVTSVTGGQTWVTAGGADQIQVGCGAAVIAVAGLGKLIAVAINTTAAGAITLSDARGTIAVIPSNVTVGTYYRYDLDFVGDLGVALAAASDITVIHSDQR
jgi:hypothetical protein